MTDIKIYIYTYGKKVYLGKKKYGGKNVLFPLEVGVANRDSKHPVRYKLRDDVGENISKENPWYGELTGLYWVWKNRRSELVGFYHYNKFMQIYYQDIIKKMNSGIDILIIKNVLCVEHAIQSEYQSFRNVLKEYDAEFFKVYESIYNEAGSGICSGANMFLTRWELFDEYCSFLFPLLEKARIKIGEGHESAYHKRYCAFFAERLLRAWVLYKGYKYSEILVKQQGSYLFKTFVLMAYHGWFDNAPQWIKKRTDKLLRNSSYIE